MLKNAIDIVMPTFLFLVNTIFVKLKNLNMKTKNLLAILVIALFLIGSKITAQTVYITESGKKYNAKNCNIVKTGKKGITLEEAKKKGLEPCKVCKVEVEPKIADKPKAIDNAKNKTKDKK